MQIAEELCSSAIKIIVKKGTVKMKLHFSKLGAMFVAIVMCMNLAIPVAQAYAYEESVATIPSKDEIIEELVKIGFTDKEIEELFVRFPYEEDITLFSDSSHPDKTETYYISTNYVKGLGYSIQIGNAGLGLTSAAWAKIIVKCVGWKIAVLASAIGLAVADMFMGPNGVKIEVTYRWTYGDNSMTWQYLPVAFKNTKY